MHLSPKDYILACHRFIELLKPLGVLILSFRGTRTLNQRENGKLYQAINVDELRTLFNSLNCSIQLYETTEEQQRQLTWHNLVIKKLKHPAE